MKILWKGTVSAEFRAIRLKLCGNCAFPQNFHISKLGEITVFFAVLVTLECPYLNVPDTTQPHMAKSYLKSNKYIKTTCKVQVDSALFSFL